MDILHSQAVIFMSQTNNKFKLWESCMLIALSLGLCAGLWAQGRQNNISAELVRLHVIAVSDEENEQQLKLRVRDAVLEVMRTLADKYGITDAQSAAEAVSENTVLLESTARNVITAAGYDYPVSIEVCREYFPTREYDGVRLPAGEYNAVRILIGSASGQNWWCVLYPALCLDAAEPEKELAEAGFTGAQIRLLTDSEAPRYVLRFKILEWAAELKNLFRK